MSPLPPETAPSPPMPLSMVKTGRGVRVVGVYAGRGLSQRLAEMGFVPGVELRVVRNDATGPLVVQVKESRLMIGRGIANKIMVG